MRKLFNYLGPNNTVIAVTLLATLSSIFLTVIGYSLANIALQAANLFLAGLIALIITPALAIPIVSQLFKVSALEEDNRQLATYDQLTGLLTRNAFMGRAESYIKLAARRRSSFALAFIDIDDFKSINDNYGHTVGDSFLSELGKALKTVQRDSDLAGRYGGDEFVILLPETDLSGAQSLAHKIQDSAGRVVIEVDKEKLSTSVSIGVMVSRYSEKRLTLEECLKQSDKALYRAKKAGKNCTAFFSTAIENQSSLDV
jgi:diguanylate cyclase (GGDEF)-like protein